MSKIKNRWLYLAGLIVILLSLSLYPYKKMIILRTEKFSCSFRDDVLTLQWIHSVEREIWRESYRVENENLVLFQSQFKTFGAGTPYNEPLIVKDGFVESSPNLVMPVINWIVSKNVESTIFTQHGEIPIYQSLADYSEVTILVHKKNIWTFLEDTCYDRFTAENR